MRGLALLLLLAEASALHPAHALLRAGDRHASRSGPIVCGRKGRPKMPGGGTMAYGQQAQPQPQKASPDGMPLFYLYCRSGPGKPWYPVSMMKGDGQSKGLINAWLGAPVAKGVFKNRLDSGMARSIFESERRLAALAVEQYSHMKKLKSNLQWGYKIVDNDVMAKEASGEIEKQKIIPVTRDMVSSGVLDQAKKAFNL
ncbi:hypothetical protein AB1Y20_022964 [Prymnesium parvum]|uniref:Uncharacterized protein n=1 Tax=Prymnesium parvum TaxID=97485 RepID=A0AB34JF98_PRYPA